MDEKDKKPDLVERAHHRAKEISSAVARNNQGIDLELLAEILSELRRLNEREEAPGYFRRFFHWAGKPIRRFRRWRIKENNG